MATKIYFFASFDQLDNAGIDNGQTTAEAFGPDLSHTTSERFLLSSVHRRKLGSTDDVKAIAVVEGTIVAQPDKDDPSLTTIYLKPRNQPGENNEVALPKVKYFVYRGIQTASLFDDDTVERPDYVAANNGVNLVDYLNNHSVDPPPVEGTALLPSKTTALDRDTPIEYSFNKDFIDPADSGAVVHDSSFAKAGWSIGLFNPTGYSFEIVLDDIAFEPTINDATTSSPPYHYLDVPLPASSSQADFFINANAKEAVVHYLDPAAFYGALYFTKIKYVDATGQPDFEDMMAKFANLNKLYIDIRNEHNLSFNYYNSIAANGYYSQYSSDTITLEIENTGGVISNSINYYISDWPLLIIDGSVTGHFPTGNTSDKNIIRIKLPTGNKSNPVLFISVAYKNDGTPSNNFLKKEFAPNERFLELALNSGEYGTFESAIPDIAGLPVASYIRIKYLQRLSTSITFDVCDTEASSNIPVQTEVQFLDNIFFPYQMFVLPRFTSNTIVTKVYDEETYVDLIQPRLYGIEDVSNVGIAEDNNTITLFAFAKFKNYNTSKTLSKNIIKTGSFEKTGGDSFIISFASKILDVVLSEVILDSNDFGQNPVSYLQQVPKKGHVPKKGVVEEAEGDDLIALIFNKSNFTTQMAAAMSTAGFTPGFPVRLCITNRNDRDDNPKNEKDNQGLNFFRCEMTLRGFEVNSSGITEIVYPLPINMFAYQNKEDKIIQLILRDELSVLTGASRIPYTCNNQIHRDITKPTPPTLSFTPSNNNIDEIFGIVYQEDVVEFIDKCYAASGIATGNVIHYSSFLSYAYALSAYVVPNGTIPVTYGTQNVTSPASENVIVPQTPTALQFVPGTLVGTPDPWNGGPGTLIYPLVRNAGALVEASMAMAIAKISSDLNEVVKILSTITFVSPGSFTDYRDQYTQTIGLLRTAYPFFNNLCVTLREKGIPLGETLPISDPTNPKESFEDYNNLFRPRIRHSDFVNSLNLLWVQVYGPLTKSNEHDFLEIVRAFTSEKSVYINFLARCIYEALGGDAGGFNLGFVGSGKGINTRAIFNDSTGNLMICYDAISATFSVRGIAVETNFDNSVVTIPLERSPGMNRVVHFGIYGLDSNDRGTFIRFSILGYKNTDCDKPIAGMVIGGHDRTSGTVTYDVFTPTANQSGKIGNNDPYVGGSPGASFMSYLGSSSTGNAGTFNDVTKDITITDDSIDYLVVKRTVWDDLTDVNDSGSYGIEDMVLLYASFYANPSSDFAYSKSFENLFADDEFRPTPTNRDRLFDDFPQEKIAIMMKYINAATTISFQMLGGFIGRPVLPFIFDQNKAGGYVAGDSVVFSSPLGGDYPHNASVFKAVSNVPMGTDPDNTTYWQEQLITTTTYIPGDIVVEGNSFYRAILPITSSGVTTTDPSGTWAFITIRFDSSGTTLYNPGDKVLANGEYYQCFRAPTGNAFNANDWFLLSRIESDDRYAYTGTNLGPADPNFIEEANPPTSGTLKADVFPRLRYANMTMEYSQTTGEFKIYVQAYASPLRSRLDQVLTSGSLTLVDQCTIYGQNNTTAATPGAGIPSYNQVLTALRCFGIIEAFIYKLGEFETVMPNYVGASARLETEFRAVTTHVEATAANPTYSIIQTFIDHSTHDFDDIF